MRVGIIALLHESNTFIGEPTTYDHFESDVLLHGDAVRDRFEHSHHEIGGFFAGLAQHDITAVPIFAARAVPYGPVEADTFQRLLDAMFQHLDTAGQLDGILVAPHGATVSETHRDADGFWLSVLRERVGPRFPLMGTLDPHANLSAKMLEATDALVAYRTNPHLDQRDRGMEAAELMARALKGDIRPVQSAAFPRMAINIERQHTSEPHWKELLAELDRVRSLPEVLSASVLLGFPYADVAEMGSAALVVADSDHGLATTLASQVGDQMWSQRSDFAGDLKSVDRALLDAEELEGPICLLDMGDNVGGGSPADGTHLLHALHRHGWNPALVCICDPASVSAARQAGIGGRCQLQVGGKTDAMHGPPFEDGFRVLGMYDGKFVEPQPRHGGFTECDQGPSVVVQNDTGMTILLTSRRMPPFSLQQLVTCNLDPSNYRAIVAKGVNAPVAAYAPVCKHLIRVNTPGCTTADMTTLDYHQRRRPMFPFELI